MTDKRKEQMLMGTEDAKKTSRLKLAIDIGHENVVVAVYNQSAKRAECIATRDGGYQFSSSVYFESNEHCIVGDVAKSQSSIEPRLQKPDGSGDHSQNRGRRGSRSKAA